MLKTDLFLCDRKLSLNQNVWHDHAFMQHDILLYFGLQFEIPQLLTVSLSIPIYQLAWFLLTATR